MHTTNYYNTLIEIAEDCKATKGETPPQKGVKKSIANMQFEMIGGEPYKYSSDEIIFDIFAHRNEIPRKDLEKARREFFSKGQPCLRTSPLAKTYGWGIHQNAEGRVAIYPVESAEYKKLLADNSITKTKAMRSSRK